MQAATMMGQQAAKWTAMEQGTEPPSAPGEPPATARALRGRPGPFKTTSILSWQRRQSTQHLLYIYIAAPMAGGDDSGSLLS